MRRLTFPLAVPAGLRAAQVDELPELSNRSDVARAIARGRPRELQESGMEGRAVVELVVDREGNVSGVKAVESTHPAFGEHASRVAATMRFSPARLKGEAVPVRVILPVTFGGVVGVRVETREVPSSPSWLPADVRMVPFPRTTEGTRGNP
jgi:TonB family protein